MQKIIDVAIRQWGSAYAATLQCNHIVSIYNSAQKRAKCRECDKGTQRVTKVERLSRDPKDLRYRATLECQHMKITPTKPPKRLACPVCNKKPVETLEETAQRRALGTGELE